MKQCITCLGDNVTNVVEGNRIFYYCNTCHSKNTRCIGTGEKFQSRSEHNFTVHLSVAVLIKKNNKYLLINRRDFPFGLSVPVGHIKEDENFNHALNRKVVEETGLSITTKKLILKETFTDHCKYGADLHEWHLYECTASGQLVTCFESSDFLWVKRENISKLNLTPPTKYILSKAGFINKNYAEKSGYSLSAFLKNRQQPEENKSVIENLPFPIMVFDRMLNLIQSNQAAIKLLNSISAHNRLEHLDLQKSIYDTVQKAISEHRSLSKKINIHGNSFDLIAHIYHKNKNVDGVTLTFKYIAKNDDAEIGNLLAYQTSLALATGKGSLKIISTILKQLLYSMNLTTSSLMLVKNNYLHTVLQYGTDKKKRKPVKLKIGESIAGQVAKDGKVITIKDIDKSPLYVGKKISCREKSLLCVPVIIDKSVVGVLCSTRPRDYFFSEYEVKTIYSVTNKIAIAIENGRLYKQLENEKNILNKVLDTTTNGIILVDQNMKISYINKAAMTMSNIKEDEKDAAAISNNFSKTEYTRLIKYFNQALGEYKRITKNFTVNKFGGYFRITFNPVAEKHSMSKQILIVINDITKLKRKQEAIKEENRKIGTIIDNIADGILVVDNKGKIVLTNKKLDKIRNFQKFSKLSRNKAIELFKDMFMPSAEILKSPRPTWKEIGLKDIDGDDYWLNLFYSFVEKDNGKPLYTIIIVRDIMKEKIFENKQREFVYTVTHELRTPITAIKGYLSMILNGDAGEINSKQVDYFNRAYKSTEKLVGLIEEILQAARLENDRVSYEIKPFPASDLINEAIDIFKQKALANDIVLDSKLKKSDLEILGDYSRCLQALSNLIDNALKYTKRGKILITLNEDSKFGIITIKDTGIGLNSKDQKLIFDKFYRASNSQSVKEGGTGLGLFIVKNIIEKQGGKIRVKSRLGKGSEFAFSLPLYKS